jgi:hypothetical protein
MITHGVVSDDDFINSETRHTSSGPSGRSTWPRRPSRSCWSAGAYVTQLRSTGRLRSLLRPKDGRPNGLLAIDLSQSGKIRGDLPRRVRHNVDSGDALHRPYPREGAQLLRWIHAAWQARDQEHLIVNPRTRKTWNTPRL